MPNEQAILELEKRVSRLERSARKAKIWAVVLVLLALFFKGLGGFIFDKLDPYFPWLRTVTARRFVVEDPHGRPRATFGITEDLASSTDNVHVALALWNQQQEPLLMFQLEGDSPSVVLSRPGGSKAAVFAALAGRCPQVSFYDLLGEEFYTAPSDSACSFAYDPQAYRRASAGDFEFEGVSFAEYLTRLRDGDDDERAQAAQALVSIAREIASQPPNAPGTDRHLRRIENALNDAWFTVLTRGSPVHKNLIRRLETANDEASKLYFSWLARKYDIRSPAADDQTP